MNSVTRGHHGAGKHIRAKRPRGAYGPRDSARRAAWLKTDAGQAWSARRRPSAADDTAINPVEKKPVERASFTGNVTGAWLNAASERNATRAVELFGEEQFGLRRGEAATPEALGRLAGAPDGSRIVVECDFTEADGRGEQYDSARLTLTVKHPYISEMDRRFDLYQDFERTERNAVCTNENLFLKPDAPAGFGTDIFLQQVEVLSRARFQTIETTGIGNGLALAAHEARARAAVADGSTGVARKPTLGFYVWPRLGYDANIPPGVARQLPEQYQGARTVRDLMKQPGGAQWWKYNGEGMQYTFDLRPGSEAIEIARAYAAERRAATATKSLLARAASLKRSANDVSIIGAALVTRGHHYGGKHEREPKPRTAYGSTGPRNPAARAEWLKTDEGKAWEARQQAKRDAAAARAARAARRNVKPAPAVPADEDERARWIEETDEGKRWHDQQVAERQTRAQAAARASGKAETGEEFVERLRAIQSAVEEHAQRFHAASDAAAKQTVILRAAEDALTTAISDAARKPDGGTVNYEAARRAIAARFGITDQQLDGDAPPPRLADGLDASAEWQAFKPKLQGVYGGKQARAIAIDEYMRAQAAYDEVAQTARAKAHAELLEASPSWKSLRAPAPGAEESAVLASEGLPDSGSPTGDTRAWFKASAARDAADFVSRALGPVAAERLYAPNEQATASVASNIYAADVTKAGRVSAPNGGGRENLDVVAFRRSPRDRSSYANPLVTGIDISGAPIAADQPARTVLRAAVLVRPTAEPRVYVHELAHHLEERHRDMYATLQQWKDGRTAGEAARAFGPGFGADERGKRDRFVDAYVGKEYDGLRASEILSMGMERLYAAPVMLARDDADYVATLYAALKGVPKARKAPASAKGYLDAIDEHIGAAVVTRGHHGAGKHVRARRPRQAYGPRDAGKRAEWLKTEAGQAWSKRRAAIAPQPKPEPKPSGGVTFTGEVTGEWMPGGHSPAALVSAVGRRTLGLEAPETLTPEHFGRLLGLPDGARVECELTARGGGSYRIAVDVYHPHVDRMRRVITVKKGEMSVYNSEFFAADDAPAGFGTEVFLSQVKSLSAAGVKEIRTHGVGSGRELAGHERRNRERVADGKPPFPAKPTLGYYVWPRLGYDAPLESRDRLALLNAPEHLKGAETVRELMARPGGNEWWKRNGTDKDFTFDLRPGSASRKVAEAYVAERRAATAAKALRVWAVKRVIRARFGAAEWEGIR